MSGHSQAEAGIDRGKVRASSCSCREVCVVGAGDNMEMVPEAGRAIVGQAYVSRCLQAQLDATKVERKSSQIIKRISKTDIKAILKKDGAPVNRCYEVPCRGVKSQWVSAKSLAPPRLFVPA